MTHEVTHTGWPSRAQRIRMRAVSPESCSGAVVFSTMSARGRACQPAPKRISLMRSPSSTSSSTEATHSMALSLASSRACVPRRVRAASGRSSGSMQSLLKSMAGSMWPSLAVASRSASVPGRITGRAPPAPRSSMYAAPEPEPKTRPSAPPSGRPSSGRRPASTKDEGAVASAALHLVLGEVHAAAVAADAAGAEQRDGLVVLDEHAGPLEHAQRALVDGGDRRRFGKLVADRHLTPPA